MRIRTIKPIVCTSRTVANLSSDSVRLHWERLWMYADDEGRGIDDPRLIKAALFPLDDRKTPKVINNYQTELAKKGFIVRYRVDDQPVFAIPTFLEHQKIDHPKKSEIRPPEEADPEPPPEPDERFTEPSPKPPRNAPDSSLLEVEVEVEVEGNREVEGKGSLALAPLDAEDDRPPSSQQAMFVALAEGCGWNVHQITDSARGGLGKAAKELLKVGASPGEVRGRAAAYRQKFPKAALTPTALAKHWASCEPSRQPLPARMAGISVLMGGASA